MNKKNLQSILAKSLICILKKYDYFKGKRPPNEDVDAWEILHSTPLKVLNDYGVQPILNENLIYLIISRKKNPDWLELNTYYNLVKNINPDIVANLTYEELHKRLAHNAPKLDDNRIIPKEGIENLLTVFKDNPEYESCPDYDYKYYSQITLPKTSDEVTPGLAVTMDVLSENSMVRVFKIYRDDQAVFRAIKVIPRNEGESGKQLADRMMTEAKIATRITHPAVVINPESVTWQDYSYFEGDYITGSDLDHHLTITKKLPPIVACALCMSICRGLVATHNNHFSLFNEDFSGIVHRNLKPANIMLTQMGEIKILDYGIARPISMGFHSNTGVFTGSLQYAAPEQLDSNNVDQRTDVYSLATILYEILTGQKIFPQKNSHAILRAKLNNTFCPLTNYRIKVPNSLNKVINTCLALKKDNRFATSEDLYYALEGTFIRLTREQPHAVLQDYISRIPIWTLTCEVHTHKKKGKFFQKRKMKKSN